ncbi:MAG: hypothetical protein MJK04_03075 [Psychrosphaera sp.]|nr:hypothetical protein [Psychrosphaera sp.]
MSKVIVISITGTADNLVIAPLQPSVKQKEIVTFENHSNVTVFINFTDKFPFRPSVDTEFNGKFGVVVEGVIGGVILANPRSTDNYRFVVDSTSFEGLVDVYAPAHGEIVVDP